MEKYEWRIEKKEGKKYVCHGTINTDKEFVLERYASDMTYKFLFGSKSYKRIETRQNYDGTITVKFSHDNGYRTVYTIPYRI